MTAGLHRLQSIVVGDSHLDVRISVLVQSANDASHGRDDAGYALVLSLLTESPLNVEMGHFHFAGRLPSDEDRDPSL